MKYIAVLIVLFSPALAGAQTQSCCASPTAQFAAFTGDRGFVMAHDEPLPAPSVTYAGQMTSFKTSDGGQGSAYAVVAAKPTKKYLFVVHEWWGLNDYIKQEADRLQKELGNVNVLALDLYDGQVASKREDAAKLMGGVKEERVRTIIEGALEHAGEDARVATIGWCFGGGWSLQSSILAGFRAAACVMYYGMPEKEVEKLKHLNAPVLGIFATKDAWITPQVVKEFEAAMKKAGKKLTVRSYNADHAFANPSNPNFDKEATGKAHAEAIAFLKKHLK